MSSLHKKAAHTTETNNGAKPEILARQCMKGRFWCCSMNGRGMISARLMRGFKSYFLFRTEGIQKFTFVDPGSYKCGSRVAEHSCTM